jgi:uncharacterized membrane protein SpoIIM required for sporulation
MAGGVFIGLGTLINAVYNGFFTADIFASAYHAGMSVNSILKATLPHSFELLGFWLSGAVGFMLAWNIVLLVCGKECFTKVFYRCVGVATVSACAIILAAAYVEAYISTSISIQ